MTDDDQEEKIDRSQWIDWSDEDPIVKPERRDIVKHTTDRGGLEYRVLSRATLLTCIYNADYITGEQFKAACDYQVWRDYLAAQITGRPMAPYWENIGPAISDGLTSFLFVLLLQRLHRDDQRIIDHALDTFVDSYEKVWLLERGGRNYQRAFSRLLELMTKIKKAAEQVTKKDKVTDPERIGKAILREMIRG